MVLVFDVLSFLPADFAPDADVSECERFVILLGCRDFEYWDNFVIKVGTRCAYTSLCMSNPPPMSFLVQPPMSNPPLKWRSHHFKSDWHDFHSRWRGTDELTNSGTEMTRI